VEANQANLDFFKTSLGVSLLYGWALNQYADPTMPYYIGRYFSFDKMFQGLADRASDDANIKAFLKSTFTRGLAAVEADRWAFYDHMVYLPYAIAKVRETAVVIDAVAADDDAHVAADDDGDVAAHHRAEGAVSTARLSKARALSEAQPLADAAGALVQRPSMNMVIADARRSLDEERIEAANLVRAPGRAVHLIDERTFGDPQANCNANNFIGLQQTTIQWRQHCDGIDPTVLEIFRSLPDCTPDDYHFREQKLVAHMETIRAAMSKAKNPTPTKNCPAKSSAVLYYSMGAVVVVAIIGAWAIRSERVGNLKQSLNGGSYFSFLKFVVKRGIE
jgi:hypothetical protein